MSNYATLKANIAQYIKENHENDITGNLLQQQLLAMVNSLGVGYQYAGIATPATNPGTPDQRVFYIAFSPGNYVNFGSGFDVSGYNLSILKYDDSWSMVETNIPTNWVLTNKTGIASLIVNEAISSSTGTADSADGWVITERIPIKDVTKFTLNYNNSLGYYFYNANIYNANGTFLGTVGGGNEDVNKKYEINASVILAAYPTAAYVAFNIWGGSSHPAVSSADVSDINVCAIGLGIQKFGLQIEELTRLIYGTVNIKLNLSISQSTGAIDYANGWVITEKIPIANIEKVTLNPSNSLHYYFYNVIVYNSSNTFLGYLPAGVFEDTKKYEFLTNDVLTAFPDAAYIAFNIWGGSSHPDLTPGDVTDLVVSAGGILADIDEIKNEINAINFELDINKYLLILNMAISQTTGGSDSADGWIITEKIPIANVINFLLNENNGLHYYFYNVIVYDSGNNFLGYLSAGNTYSEKRYKFPASEIIAAYPTAVYVAFNIWGGSSHAAITTNDVADMVVKTQNNGIAGNVAELDERVDILEQQIGGLVGGIKLTVDLPNRGLSVESELSDRYNVINYGTWEDSNLYDRNPCFNFAGTYLVRKSDLAQIKINDEGDNIGAASTQVNVIGGNHALFPIYICTITGHGKTYADIGSEWNGSDGHKWYIVRIVNANQLVLVSEYYLEDGLYHFYATMAAGVTLTHSSGATHTNSMSVESVTNAQWYPSEKIVKQVVLLDGKEITESGTYYGTVVDFLEVYDLYSPVSYLDKLKSLVGTLTENPLPRNYSDISKWFRICNDYRFTKGGCNVLFVDWVALAEIDLNYYNPINAKLMMAAAMGGNIQYYLPKALPITVNGQTYDYRRPVAYQYNNEQHWTQQYWENPNLPPDRGIEFLTDGTKRVVGMHHGYLFDQGIGGLTRKDYLTDAWWIYTSGAVYAGGVNGGKYGNTVRQQIGSHYGFAAFRKYEDYTDNPTGLISNSQFDANGKHYIYVDFDGSGLFSVSVPDEWCGKEIKVFEKSNNVTLLNQFAQKEILFNVTTSSPMYGYFVAEIEK